MRSELRAGLLPKVMPVSLEVLMLDGGYGDDTHKFTGGIPAEWDSLTNLKKLSMECCGLEGASLGLTRHTTRGSELRSDSESHAQGRCR